MLIYTLKQQERLKIHTYEFLPFAYTCTCISYLIRKKEKEEGPWIVSLFK